ncbi:S-adenosyl-L-methionine-dependent methyltransferase [Aspergillus avenaceus]|uniref:S-adenosyl-L-methionine-dependent methyltransferase n=1 Tax=Aspergillus avenaceus TaxID=36643 RepID=A0A5N6TIV0_ASPAV|nr:S-adenosyl-L-methionine-dependent methyltransferase [Aspergillus avenaceus]
MEHIAVDPDFDSIAAGYGTDPEDFQSDTTSITSSIAKGRFENGRRYQSLKEDDYWGPSDAQQFEAFEIGHMMFRVLDHNQPNPLFRAPIKESPKNILDIGTGQGNWAIDVADLYPDTTVRGVDMFPPPVIWVPPNCIFEVDDVLREWTWQEPFDFIHMRLMYGAFTSEGWDQLYKQAYDALEPGGWIEQMELDVRVYSDDGSLKQEHQLHGWGNMFVECSERAGRSLRTHETMRDAIQRAGFVDVHEEKYKIPIGPWPKDKSLREVGHLQYAHWSTALEGWAMWLLTHFGEPEPWTKKQVHEYLSKVRMELKDPHIHCYEPATRVWARKPTLEEMQQ